MAITSYDMHQNLVASIVISFGNYSHQKHFMKKVLDLILKILYITYPN